MSKKTINVLGSIGCVYYRVKAVDEESKVYFEDMFSNTISESREGHPPYMGSFTWLILSEKETRERCKLTMEQVAEELRKKYPEHCININEEINNEEFVMM